MPKKPRERYKDRNPSPATDADARPSQTLEILKRRRYKRFLFVAVIGISFPIFELIAYQYRAITISFTNRSDQLVRSVKVTYDGGTLEIPEIKPGGVEVRLIRPNFTFKSTNFATYSMSIRLALENGNFFGQMGRAGALDFSAKELYSIEPAPPNGNVELKHITRPGFPLGLVRDLMERLGIG